MEEALIYRSAKEIPHPAFYLCMPCVGAKANNADMEMKVEKISI